jgi:hypothetical protein
MPIRPVPEVGCWYIHRDKGQMFQVVAVDEDEAVIETQDIDGDVDEIEFAEWRRMPLEAAEPPEDARGPADDGFEDDEEPAAGEHAAHDWRGPVDGLPLGPQDAVEADDADLEA